MSAFPTAIQNTCLSLIFRAMKECRNNRTYAEYMDIAARLPALKVLHFQVNEELKKFRRTQGDQLPQICRFKAGDKRICYEPYPESISYETVRDALTVAGMRVPRRRRRH